MEMFIDMKGVPTRIGDRVSVVDGEGVSRWVGNVATITPTGVDVLLDRADHPERFVHTDVCRTIQRVNTLEIATQMVRDLMEALETAMEAEENAEKKKEESEDVDERSLYYTHGKHWAFRRAKSFVWHTLRGIERLEMAQDF